MRRAVVLVVLLVVPLLAGAAPAADPVGDSNRTGQRLAFASGDFDRTRFEITVYRNGSAEWTFRYMRYLPDDESVAQFREYADRFESEETDLYTDFVARATQLARIGRNQTGRSMAAAGFSRRAFVDRGINDVGVVELSFRWDAFARVEAQRVVVGDVFEGGLFLGPNQSLVIEPGPNLTMESVAPNGTLSGATLADSDSVTWRGQREFFDERPRVVFVVSSGTGETPTSDRPGTATSTGDTTGSDGGDGAGTTTGTGDGDGSTTGAGGAEGDGGGGLSAIALLVGAVVLLIGLVGGFAYRRRGGFGPATRSNSGSDAGGGARVEPHTDSAFETDDGVPRAGSSTTSGGTPDLQVPESAVLSDEERVLELLESNGGRMRQVNIVDETEWSKSKVSMLLSDMEEDGTISKLRVGRENIISLAGHEPDAARSPFEDLEDPDHDSDPDLDPDDDV